MGNARQRLAAKRKLEGASATTPTAVTTVQPQLDVSQRVWLPKSEVKKQRRENKQAAPEAAAAELPASRNTFAGQKDVSSEGVGNRKATGGNDDQFLVVVKGLPFAAEMDMVRKDFSECGAIVKFHMPLASDGSTRGMAFISFSDEESVNKALKFHETDYGGRWLQVQASSDKPGGQKVTGSHGSEKVVMRNKELEVFVGGLTWEANEDSVRKYFHECGKIAYCRVPLNDEGSARGFAFVEFADRECVDKALLFHDAEHLGRRLQVRPSGQDSKVKVSTAINQKGYGKEDNTTIDCKSDLEVFIFGLPPSTTAESLKAIFADCGDIRKLTLPVEPDGVARGMAFIEFKNKDSCNNAVELNNTRPAGQLLSVRMSAFNGFEARAHRRAAMR